MYVCNNKFKIQMIKNIIILILAISTCVLSCLLVQSQKETNSKSALRAPDTSAPRPKKYATTLSPIPCTDAYNQALAYKLFMSNYPTDRAAFQIDTSYLQSLIRTTKTKYIVGTFGRVAETVDELAHNTVHLFPVNANGYRINVENDARFPAGHVDQKYPIHKEPLGTINYTALFSCP